VILLDAFALIALQRDEPAAQAVAEIIASGDAGIPSVNLAEVLDQLIRLDGVPADRLGRAFSGFVSAGLVVVHTRDETPWAAARLRARHYRRRGGALSLPDCILLATADAGDTIATADRPVLAAARAEGIDVMPLPDSAGRTG
jgi:predicted nucleic acid-binding protein